MPKTFKTDIAGKRFGKLLVVRFVPDDTKYSSWECLCDCGKKKVILHQSLRRGATVSCGCFHKERLGEANKTHGESGKSSRTREYRIWANMMDRCHWGKTPSFAYYGARGIKVCDRWHSYENFLADMGRSPEGTSLDRKDNDGNYSPDNCRWATRRQQFLNTSRTIWVSHNGNRITAFELCEQLGISRKAMRSRAVRRGNDYVSALNSMGVQVSAA